MREHKHINDRSYCSFLDEETNELCGVGMVGHLTEERYNEIVERNRKEHEERCVLMNLRAKTPENPFGVSIGSKLVPHDTSPDAPRRLAPNSGLNTTEYKRYVKEYLKSLNEEEE